MRLVRTFGVIWLLLLALLSGRWSSAMKPVQDSGRKGEAKEREGLADPEREALLKRLEGLSLAKLKELEATELVAYERWRHQNHLNAKCEIERRGLSRSASTPRKEAELTAQCANWRERIELIEKAVSD